jgi:hypothetical protein
MPFISDPRHQLPYLAPKDAEQRLEDVTRLLSTIRDMPLHATTKKLMLNRTIWLVVELTGNFYSRFRSAGVLANVGVRIQRDHIYPRKQLVAEVLAGEDLASIVKRAQCCIVTREDHDLLSKVKAIVQGRERYALAGVEIHDMATHFHLPPS